MRKKQISVSVPTLIDTREFHPTCVMQKVLLSHLREISDPTCEGVTNPPKFLAAMGHDRSNWYKWQKMQGFKEWWNKAIEDELRGNTLRKVHSNLAKLAQTQRDSSVIKLFLERFDKEYKPKTHEEHSFAGMAPPEQIEAAVERSRLRAEQIRRQIQAQDVTEIKNSGENDSL